MANVTYDSPASLGGQLGFQPDGFLGGALFQEHEDDRRSAVQSGQAMKILGYQEEQNKLKDYNLDEPVRASKRLSDMATYDANTPAVANSIAGGQAAEGDVKAQTIKQQVGLKTQELADKQEAGNQIKFKNHMANIDGLAPILNQLGPDPQSIEKYQQIRQQRPDLGLPAQFDPTHIRQMTFVANAYMDQEAKRQQAAEMAKQAAETARAKYTADTHLKGVQGTNATSVKVAELNKEARLAVEKPLNMSQTEADWRDTLSKGPSEKDGGAAYEAATNGMRSLIYQKVSTDPQYKALSQAYGLALLGDTPEKKKSAADIQKQMTDLKEEITMTALGTAGGKVLRNPAGAAGKPIDPGTDALSADMKAKVESLGHKYEPNKYRYFIENGRLKAEPK